MATHTSAGQVPIGEISRRAGVSVSTLRYYEEQGLIASTGRVNNKRVFSRAVLRRLAFINAAQKVGLSIDEIRGSLARLPLQTAPSPADWNRLSEPWKERVDRSIRQLQALRTSLDSCIGCGCLSLDSCGILNPDDEAAAEGPGSRWIRAAKDPGKRRG